MTRLLLSIEPWDAVWRRNQHLASRVGDVIFSEPPSPGRRFQLRCEQGIRVVTPPKLVPHRWSGGRWADAALVRLVDHERLLQGVEVLWVTHPFQWPLAAMLGHPIVYDRTDDWPAMEASVRDARIAAAYEARLMRRARRVVVVSEQMRGRAGVDAVVIPNGVDLEPYASPPSPPRGARIRAGFAGTLDPTRIDFRVLEQIALLPDVDVVVAGPGARPRGVEWKGPLDHREIPAFLYSCDVLLAPYRVDAEANRSADALKLYEYFATGRPVVATPTAGFERHSDLVTMWPVQGRLGDAIDAQQVNCGHRREVAATAGWGERARRMSDLLDEAVHR